MHLYVYTFLGHFLPKKGVTYIIIPDNKGNLGKLTYKYNFSFLVNPFIS